MTEETNKEFVWCYDGGQIMHAIFSHENDVHRALCGTIGRYRQYFVTDDPPCKRCLKVIKARRLVDVTEHPTHCEKMEKGVITRKERGADGQWRLVD